MQSWNLAAGDPLSLTLAADTRLTPTDYTDDQIWELNLGGGEPPALALQTTYGLRAHWMRLFPRFIRGETTRVDPASFHAPPCITRFSSNYLAVTYQPFDGLHVLAEYRAVESRVIAGRIQLTNHNILPVNLRLEWVALLNPIDRQGGMAPVQTGPTYVLEGETAYLHPVISLTGPVQAGSGPYPALVLDLELYPGNVRQFTWSAASFRTGEASLEAARLATARPWEAEQARMELCNCSDAVQIDTGNPEWDAVLALSQKTAFELLMKADTALPNPSFVLSRRPDQGFSARGDGSDHPYLWNGQTALDSLYLASLLLPGAPELAGGLLRNFLATQEENGFIDGKPGLAGQRSRQLAQPLLATLAVEAGPYLPQPDWYREVFPGLLRFFNAWFDPQVDQDGDGFPEWQHPLQSGIEDSPILDRWSTHSQGVEVTRLESPALAAMLFRECQSLIEMARSLASSEESQAAYARLSGVEPEGLSGAAEALPGLCQREQALLDLLQSTWDPQARVYRYRDYQTHLSLPGRLVSEFNGSRHFSLSKRLGQPHRLVVHLTVSQERTYAATVTIHGFSAGGEVSETLAPRSFRWQGTQARATTLNSFLAVRRIEVDGLTRADQVRIFAADLTQEDCSLLLPLWAGAADLEQAQQLVEQTLLPRYLLPFGIPLCPPDRLPPDIRAEESPTSPGFPALSAAPGPWNALIGEGLLRYGYRAQAAQLVGRLLNAAAAQLKIHRAFRQYSNASTGQGTGERGHLHGLAPVGLFLHAAGIRELSPKSILIDGFNPFPGVIQVKYRKVRVICHAEHTQVTFSSGQSIVIDQPGPHRVTLT